MTVTLRVRNAFAELCGAPVSYLEECLALLEPKRKYSKAYREGRWDGKIRLYEGKMFPAGLVQHVSDYLMSQGKEVKIIEQVETVEIDTTRFTPDYLPGITLWDHQYEAALQMFKIPRGIIKSPTSSGKTEIVAAVARYLWEEKNYRTLVIVPKRGLLGQTVKRFEKYYQGDIEVGMYGDGVKRPGDIAVGTVQTLISFQPRIYKNKTLPLDRDIRQMIKSYEVLIHDETHHSSAYTYMEISYYSNAVRKYGLSGTPIKHKEIADMRMMGVTGPIIFDCDTQQLIANNLAAKPKICMVLSDEVSGPEFPKVHTFIRDKYTKKCRQVERLLPYAEAYTKAVIERKPYNRAVIAAACWLVDNGKQTLILCRRKEHWRKLRALLDETGIDYAAVWGDTDTEAREEAKRLFTEKKIKLLLATVIYDEGEDVPSINAIVLAEGVKVPTNVLQRIGRGMRVKRDGENEVWIVDFVPTCHARLIEHGLERAKAYEEEGHEVYVLEEWCVEDDDTELLPFLSWDELDRS